MKKLNRRAVLLCALTLVASAHGADITDSESRFAGLRPMDVFQLEYVSSPEISASGDRIVYVRNFMDIMKDARRSNIWEVAPNGTNHRPITTGNVNTGSPRVSPNGARLLYTSSEDGSTEIYCRWFDTGQVAKLTQLEKSPGSIEWSPDGKRIAFTMFVPKDRPPLVSPPPKPKGAEWADPPTVIRDVLYRSDGGGYRDYGFTHIFVLPAEGGTPRQLTSGDFNHSGPLSWTPDSQKIVFSANRRDDWEHELNDSEVYSVGIDGGELTKLTSRYGPDRSPAVSPDGSKIAYVGFDDKHLGHQTARLYLMNADGTNSQVLSKGLDRDIEQHIWNAESSGLFIRYTDRGDTKLATISMTGQVEVLTGGVGGLSLGRPYGAGEFDVAKGGRFVFTQTSPAHPADLATGKQGSGIKRLTNLNEDLFTQRKLGEVEEIWVESSADKTPIQGWIVKPPNFDPEKKYPLILEIHGGPFADYGSRFTAECQIFASAAYVTLYTNPRGSTGYGEDFANLIHHNYPGQDYDDLMSSVDAVIAKGYIDTDKLYVTGGSGGGVLTSWIIGKTDRFAAAVVAKPVINWFSFALTADIYPFFYKYWFADAPWNIPDEYMRRSPISLVGNVTTPTMLLTGEADYRTPIAESEQYYQALRLRKIESVLVRIPGASHSITARPSQFVTKVQHILKWFDEHEGASGK